MRGKFSLWLVFIAITPNKFVNSEVRGHSHGLPEQSRVKSQVKAFDAVFAIDFDSSVNWTVVLVVISFLNLH